MKITIGELRAVIREALVESRDEYVVRGGSEILTRDVDSSPRDWQWEYFQKVLYFPKSSLIKKPRGPTDLQNYVFKKDGKLYAIDARRIYYMP